MSIHPHGWRWIDYSGLAEADEREHIRKSIAQIVKLTGMSPLGYFAGLPSENTRKLVVEAGTFLYDSDVYNDDTPYWSPDYPGLLMLPYSLDTNDSRFGRAESACQICDEFVQYIKDSFNTLYKEGEDCPRMMTIGLHARLLCRPGRIGVLYKILDYMQSHDAVWIARRNEIAQHWATNAPDPRVSKSERFLAWLG